MSRQTMVQLRGLYESLLAELANHEDSVLEGVSYAAVDVLDSKVEMPDVVRFHYCLVRVEGDDDPQGLYAARLADLVEQHSDLDYQADFTPLMDEFYLLLKTYTPLKALSPYPAAGGDMVW